MRRTRFIAALGAACAVLGVTACSTGGNVYGPPPPPPAVSSAAIAYLGGDVIGGRHARALRIGKVGIRGLTPLAASTYLAKQESDLRYQTAGTGVDILRVGPDLVIRLPSNSTFDVGRAEVKPQFQSTLSEVARILKQYGQSYVDILGHSDSTGNEAANAALSDRRAKSVAAYLTAHGVSSARIATRGYGSSAAIADNATDEGRAINRRVEIKVVPVRIGDR